MNTYQAPWTRSLVWTSALATLICVGVPFGLQFLPGIQDSVPFWLGAMMLAVVAGCGLGCVRDYTITPDAILVQRSFWATRIPRAGLESARFEPRALCGSIRTCGNGGLFAWTGFFWNKAFGFYRAYVTDHRRTVVLRFATRTIVVSPDDPEEFIAALFPPTHGESRREA